jgi:glutamyl-tRNA synthetase
MSHNTSKIITRFAPSPTGNLHSGAYRTAIFSYLYARKHGGEFVLRIEDTDKERSKSEYEQNIMESLMWLGLEHDRFYRQSEHVERHRQVLEQLITDGHAYISREIAKDDSRVIKEIIRFKNPNITVTFHDEIKGEVSIDTTDLGDFVIAKNISEPLFHLAVVVDDFDAGVTHVIRGEDHVSNTPRQILIQRAIGALTPVYAHLPLVLGADKQKLSKRKGALAVTEYRDLGYLPGALLNMVAMVGWNPGTEQELFNHEELIASFELTQVQKSPAVFNEEKLNWFNREYIKVLDTETQKDFVKQFLPSDLLEKIGDEKFEKLFDVIIERVEYFDQVRQWATDGEYDYVVNTPEYEIQKVIWKTCNAEDTKKHLQYVHDTWSAHTGDWNPETLKSLVWDYAQQHGAGNVLWPVRYALTGRDKSPDPFMVAYIIDKQEAADRLQKAISNL